MKTSNFIFDTSKHNGIKNLYVKLVFVFLLIISNIPAISQQGIQLTNNEKVWLESHPVINLGFLDDNEPLAIKKDSVLSGIFVELFDRLQAIIGFKLKIYIEKSEKLDELFDNGIIDGCLACDAQVAKENGLLTTQEIFQVIPAIFKGTHLGAINSIQDLYGKRVVYKGDSKVIIEIVEEHKDSIEFVEEGSTFEAMKMVIEKKSDAYLGFNFNNYTLNHNLLDGIIFSFLVPGHNGNAVTGIRNDWPEFVSILNKGLDEIGNGEINSIISKWINLEKIDAKGLSERQNDWLQYHQFIKVGATTSFPPFQFADNSGNYQGIMADLIKILSKRLNVIMEPANRETWQQVLDEGYKKEIDMIPGISYTHERSKYLLFTRPFVSLPIVIITNQEFKQILGLNDLSGTRIAVINGSSTIDELKARVEDVQLIVFNDLNTSFQAVSEGKADALLDNIASYDYHIKKNQISNLRVAGVSPYSMELSIGVRNDWPELVDILQIELDNLTSEEKALMFEKWTHVQIEREIDWNKMIGWISVILLIATTIVGVTLYSNKKLVREIVERKRAQNKLKLAKEEVDQINKQLKVNEEKYKSLIEGVEKDYLIYSHDIDGQILYINQGAEKILGKSIESIIGRNVLDVIKFTPKSVELIEESTFKLKYGTGTVSDQLEFIHSDGELRIIEVNDTAVTGPKGNIIIYGIAKDITDIKLKENELLKAKNEAEKALEMLKLTQEQLVQSEKLASLGTLTAGVAHEINNPLNFIKSGSELLKLISEKVVGGNRVIYDADTYDVVLNNIETGVDRIVSIVKSLNSFSRSSDKTQYEACDIHMIIDNCLTILEHEYKHRVEIEKKYDNDVQTINFNESQLYQIFTNLIMNAIQAIEEEGRITINTKKAGDYLEILISDTGIGIPNDDLTKIFDPFFTTKEPGKGTGLGLSIVYNIISDHGGTITFNSTQNKGTEVLIKLSMAEL